MATHEATTETHLLLGKLDDGRAISADEFAFASFEEPWIYERIEGRLVVMSPEGTGHVIQSEPWRDRLGAYRPNRPEIVQAVVSQAWTRIDEDNTRIADIGVYLGGRLKDLEIPRQIPDLIFGFFSPSKQDRLRDYVEKRADYSKIGVREFVIIDRSAKKVTVLGLIEGVYQERVLFPSDTHRSPLLPGSELCLAEVLTR